MKVDIFQSLDKISDEVAVEDIIPPLKNSNEPILENDIINISQSVIVTKNIIDNKYIVYLFGEITYNIKHYRILFDLLDSLTKIDEIEIFIDSYGGSVSSGLLICSAMRRCKAKIITHVLGMAFSMGSMIWTFGDELKLFPGAMTMFHNISSGYYGFIGNIQKEVAHTISIGTNLMELCVDKKVLTAEEVELILNDNRELFFTYDEMLNRISPKSKKED